MTKKERLLIENKDIFWDVSDMLSLSEVTIEERFLKYGDWRGIKGLMEVYGMDKFKKNYINIINKKRCDLSKKTINYFNIYLDV